MFRNEIDLIFPNCHQPIVTETIPRLICFGCATFSAYSDYRYRSESDHNRVVTRATALCIRADLQIRRFRWK